MIQWNRLGITISNTLFFVVLAAAESNVSMLEHEQKLIEIEFVLVMMSYWLMEQ